MVVPAAHSVAKRQAVSFFGAGSLRVLENSKTGRDFLQVHGMPASPGLTRSNYFDALASPRRLKMFIALERELQRQQLPALRAHDERKAWSTSEQGKRIQAIEQLRPLMRAYL